MLIFNYILLYSFLTVIFLTELQANPTQEPWLVLDRSNDCTLPRNFRMCIDNFPKLLVKAPTRQGMDELRASASGQFSENELKMMMEKISQDPSQVIIVDLRQESHGFMNGMAVSWRTQNGWSNLGKTLNEIERDQASRLQQAIQQGCVLINYTKTQERDFVATINSINVEPEIVQSAGAHYFHLPITDYLKPNDADIDLFLDFIKNIPKRSWLHFHCCAGKGRSSTFFVIYDMLHNAKKVSLSDIFARHALIGGKDFEADFDPKKAWKHEFALERLIFLKKFYQYCQGNADLNQSWSEWSSWH